jgi:ArsR family transcriptional regulator
MNNRSCKGGIMDQLQTEARTNVKAMLPTEDVMNEVAELYKVFGDLTRIRILCALSVKEMMVTEIAETLEMTQSAISHQLRLLKASKLLKSRREGRAVIYALADDHVRTIIDCATQHVLE